MIITLEIERDADPRGRERGRGERMSSEERERRRGGGGGSCSGGGGSRWLFNTLPKLSSIPTSNNLFKRSPVVRHLSVAASFDLDEDYLSTDGDDEGQQPSYSPDLKLYVGNLPWNVDSAALAELFQRAGNVEIVEEPKASVASTMGSGHWLKIIINLHKSRKPKSKTTKGFSEPQAYNLEPKPQEKPKTTVNDIEYENKAATRIQTAFRAFKARKVLRHLKGVSRLQTLTQGDFGKKQASNTLASLQSWTKIQAQIRTRRKQMVEDGGIRRKKLENQLKLETKLHDLEVEWSGGSDTKDEALARIQQREEAAVKRERAMAYAFSNQWRPNSKSSLGPKDSKLATTNWDWSWVDRWVVAQPWENRVQGELTPKKVNSPANKAHKNSPKKTLRNRKLSYGSATKVEDANTKTETA